MNFFFVFKYTETYAKKIGPLLRAGECLHILNWEKAYIYIYITFEIYIYICIHIHTRTRRIYTGVGTTGSTHPDCLGMRVKTSENTLQKQGKAGKTRCRNKQKSRENTSSKHVIYLFVGKTYYKKLFINKILNNSEYFLNIGKML